MTDWTQDQEVVYALKRYNLAYAAWLRVGAAGETAHLDSPPEHVAIYLRLRAADRAYECARDDAIDRSLRATLSRGVVRSREGLLGS
jgi:hypothetical protein